jgi:hypothetical protein
LLEFEYAFARGTKGVGALGRQFVRWAIVHHELIGEAAIIVDNG